MADVAIPKGEVAYTLFHKRYSCLIPEMFFYSQQRLTERGVPSTGNKDYDKEMMQSPRRVDITVPEMCHFFEQGATITLVNPNHSVEIYHLIVQHIENWQWIIRTQFNFIAPPMEDFEQLQMLADAFSYSVTVLNQGRPLLSQTVKDMRALTTKAVGTLMPKKMKSVPTMKAEEQWSRRR